MLSVQFENRRSQGTTKLLGVSLGTIAGVHENGKLWGNTLEREVESNSTVEVGEGCRETLPRRENFFRQHSSADNNRFRLSSWLSDPALGSKSNQDDAIEEQVAAEDPKGALMDGVTSRRTSMLRKSMSYSAEAIDQVKSCRDGMAYRLNLATLEMNAIAVAANDLRRSSRMHSILPKIYGSLMAIGANVQTILECLGSIHPYVEIVSDDSGASQSSRGTTTCCKDKDETTHNEIENNVDPPMVHTTTTNSGFAKCTTGVRCPTDVDPIVTDCPSQPPLGELFRSNTLPGSTFTRLAKPRSSMPNSSSAPATFRVRPVPATPNTKPVPRRPRINSPLHIYSNETAKTSDLMVRSASAAETGRNYSLSPDSTNTKPVPRRPATPPPRINSPLHIYSNETATSSDLMVRSAPAAETGRNYSLSPDSPNTKPVPRRPAIPPPRINSPLHIYSNETVINSDLMARSGSAAETGWNHSLSPDSLSTKPVPRRPAIPPRRINPPLHIYSNETAKYPTSSEACSKIVQNATSPPRMVRSLSTGGSTREYGSGPDSHIAAPAPMHPPTPTSNASATYVNVKEYYSLPTSRGVALIHAADSSDNPSYMESNRLPSGGGPSASTSTGELTFSNFRMNVLGVQRVGTMKSPRTVHYHDYEEIEDFPNESRPGGFGSSGVHMPHRRIHFSVQDTCSSCKQPLSESGNKKNGIQKVWGNFKDFLRKSNRGKS